MSALGVALLAGVTTLALPERVARVEVDAPEAERERIARYVAVQAGEPYSAERVRRSVELIHATGLYRDVVVSSVATPAGRVVTFRPDPAPRLAAVRVSGSAPLSAGDVRRIARLRDAEVLWPARLDAAARDVGVALVARGHLEARVSAHASGPAAAAAAVFAIEAGPQARVSRVAIDAPDVARPLLARLRQLVRPRVGEAYERERAQRAAERMRAELVRLQRYRTSVEVVEAYDPSAASVGLRFEVDASPPVMVRFDGADVSGSAARRAERVLRDGFVSPDALGEAADLVEASLRAQGHRDARVRVSEELTPQALTVVFATAAGPRSLVASVSVDGAPEAASGVALQTRPGEPLVDDDLEADRDALVTFLEDNGYPAPRVEVTAREGGGFVPVAFRVDAGTPLRPSRVDVVGAAPQVALPELAQRSGELYRVSSLARDRDAILAAHRNAGFGDAEVRARVEGDDPAALAVVYEVAPGPRREVDRIVIAGLDRTREEVVRRELRIAEGEPLALDRLLETRRRLSSLDIFQNVEIVELPTAPGERSVVIAAREAPPTLLAYGVGYSEREKLRGSVEVTRRNLFGMNRRLSLFGRLSFKGSRAVATFREPYLFGTQQDLFVSGFREEEDRDSFDFIRFGGQAQTARNLAGGWSVIVRYSFQETRTFDIQVPIDQIDREFLQSTFSGPSTSLVFDSRDDPLEPDSGTFFGADVQLSSAALGGDSFWKGFASAAHYRGLHPRVLLAVGARFGVSGTFAGAPARLPLPDRFFLGGDYGLRGFAIDAVDRSGGNAVVYGGLELRVQALRRFSLGLFAEVGNTFPTAGDLDLGALREVAGFGLRYESAFGPIRADWGYKLDRRLGESGSRFHLTIGHAF